MDNSRSIDFIVRKRLQGWPQHPPGFPERGPRQAKWLRGRPVYQQGNNPFLRLPGSEHLRTVPDGLWINFGGTAVDAFVDIFVVEACGTLQNLLDKRSRFAPRISSLLAVCPLPWLLAPVMAGDPTPRWTATGVITDEPARQLSFPVRDIRVMYGLKPKVYDGFLKNQIPQPHEYFVPMAALTAENGDKDPIMQAFLSRAAVTSNFLTVT